MLKNLEGWHDKMSCQETKDLAYQERNLLALRFAEGWYFDTDNNWDGWKRVLSMDGGLLTFHIPDDFPVGDLREIKANWSGNTTLEKWERILVSAGVKL